MTTREAALYAVGIDMRPANNQFGAVAVADIVSHASFSGYGEYTPISVRTHTVMVDADLERNQSRD